MSKVRNIDVCDNLESLSLSDSSSFSEGDSPTEDTVEHPEEDCDEEAQVVADVAARRVSIRKSPILKCFYKHQPVPVCLDTGSETNFVFLRCVNELQVCYQDSKHGAIQADAKTRLSVVGEIKDLSLIRGAHTCLLYTSPSPRDRTRSRMPSSA